jgi:hypothetical protein
MITNTSHEEMRKGRDARGERRELLEGDGGGRFKLQEMTGQTGEARP